MTGFIIARPNTRARGRSEDHEHCDMRRYLQAAVELAMTDPGLAAKKGLLELNYVGRRANQFVHGRGTRREGYRLMERDWDTAIVLDACRYDTFRSEYDLGLGNLSKEIAPGSESREFFRRTFGGRKHHDTVYVTGNPYVTTLPSDTFHAVSLDDAWNESGTEAPPERITEAALEAHGEYPEKRIVVHYMTPHRPFIAPEMRHVEGELGHWRGMIWPGETTAEEIRRAYERNLQLVLEDVAELLEHVEGRVIVTADHGELLGERLRPVPVRCYGHFPSLYVPELVEVPWVEVPSDERRRIVSELPAEEFSVDEAERTERLRALGYLG